MKKILLIAFAALFFVALTQPGFSQTKKKTTAKDSVSRKKMYVSSTKMSAASASTWPQRISLQLEGGTQGIGADIKADVVPRLAARFGVTFAPINANNGISIDGFDTKSSENVNFANAHLWADFEPFGHASGFRLVGGAGYFFQARGKLVLTPTGTYQFGGYNLTADQVGNLDLNVDWKGVAPYFGFGLFNSFPNKFFNVNLDLGTYYLTAPSTHIVGTKLLVDNYKLEPQFNENLKNYRWLPVLQLNINFRIH